MIMKGCTVMVLLSSVLSLAAGCNLGSQQKAKDQVAAADVIPPPITDKPLTLKVYQHSANISDIEFKRRANISKTPFR